MKKNSSPYSSGFTQAHAQSYGYLLKKTNLVNDEVNLQAFFDINAGKPLPFTVLNFPEIIRSRHAHRAEQAKRPIGRLMDYKKEGERYETYK